MYVRVNILANLRLFDNLEVRVCSELPSSVQGSMHVFTYMYILP